LPNSIHKSRPSSSRSRTHAIGHLRRPQAEKERGQHTDRGLIALVRLADAHVDEPACLVDPQLLLAPVALTDAGDLRERVRRDPPLLHAPRAERLRHGQRVAVGVDGTGLHHRAVELLATPGLQVFESPTGLGVRHRPAADLAVQLEERAQPKLGDFDRPRTQAALTHLDDELLHRLAHRASCDFLEQPRLVSTGRRLRRKRGSLPGYRPLPGR
jgi:hypothetical protein